MRNEGEIRPGDRRPVRRQLRSGLAISQAELTGALVLIRLLPTGAKPEFSPPARRSFGARIPRNAPASGGQRS
jgi:hypothetical protein